MTDGGRPALGMMGPVKDRDCMMFVISSSAADWMGGRVEMADTGVGFACIAWIGGGALRFTLDAGGGTLRGALVGAPVDFGASSLALSSSARPGRFVKGSMLLRGNRPLRRRDQERELTVKKYHVR
jgi:hypothetical protein